MEAMSSSPEIETVEMMTSNSSLLARWSPSIGAETLALLDHLGLSQDSRVLLQGEAAGILSKAIPPFAPPDQETGLVFGYVQSGKTMSFTTVAALARDNGYNMVIVIAGISKPLFNQSMKRLQTDLRLLTRTDRKWLHVPNPKRRDAANITSKLADWQDEDATDDEKQTVLITVMKNHTHLTNLALTLADLNLEGVRALIIDDEADQAGLNNQVQDGTQSTTYSRLLSLRQMLPHHTYIQYTATPQALLLINLIDTLSPRFGDVLTPGSEYVGGKDFFIHHRNLIRAIPRDEIPTKVIPLVEAPDSLLAAMRVFFIGVAAGRLLNDGSRNRSMMVHPSQETMRHAEYFRWVRQIKDNWETVLNLAEQDADRQELLEDFRVAYDDIAATVPSLPSFHNISRALKRAVRGTLVTEINSARGATPNISWEDDYGHILVGGQAMDRGFTVEGLTVTYMPRSIGVGNADTIQQRARFFGYKRRYLGYCRVFLEGTASNIYRQYVDHEEDVRGRLIAHQESGLPLTEWKRAFILANALKPTRDTVLDLGYVRGNFSTDWLRARVPHDSETALAENRQTVARFLAELDQAGHILMADEGHAMRTEPQKHNVVRNVPLAFALEHLLVPFRATHSADAQSYFILMLQIQAHLEQNPDAECTIYQMSKGNERARSVLENGEIQLLQGANPNHGEIIYPGDRRIRDQNVTTIQIHTVGISETDRGVISIHDVPALAVKLSDDMSADFLSQDQGGEMAT